MDRSSFRVAITNDKDKRQAFKESLAERIVKQPEVEEKSVGVDSVIPIGRSVWHPNFGVGEIVSVSKANNQIVLSFKNHGRVSFVLNQVLSKLAPVDETIDLQHVPVKPVVVEEPAPKTEQVTPELSVELPAGFAQMAERDQFVYLKKEMLLTIDQANDVISTFKGKSPLYSKVAITMER